jgi:hypothetical protein
MTIVRYAVFSALAALSSLAALALTAAPAQAQATRTWVSGVGDDVNPCSRTAPCKTFAGAISKTAAGGEINCLDPAGFGTVTITKSITIDCTGTLGSVLNSGGINGIVVNDSATATPGTVQVILRGLTINGAGTTPGLNGVRFVSGKSLHIEDVFIQNQRGGFGVSFQPSAAARLSMKRVSIVNSGNGAIGGGVLVQPTGAAGNARVALSDMRFDGVGGDAVRLNSTGNTLVSRNEIMLHRSEITGSAGGVAAITAVGTATSFIDVNDTLIYNNTGSALSVSGTANSVIRSSGNTIVLNAFTTSIAGGGAILSYGDNETQGNSNPAAFTPPTQAQN